MNFWKSAIVSAVIAVLVVAQVWAEVSVGPKREGASASVLVWAGESLQFEYAVDGSDGCFDAAPVEDESPKLRKRARKCWRLERYVRVELTEAWNASVLIVSDLTGYDEPAAIPAAADLLFIAGGYARVFQKG